MRSDSSGSVSPLNTRIQCSGGWPSRIGNVRGVATVHEEEHLYPPCREWLAAFLTEHYRRSEITILNDTDRRKLSAVIQSAGFAEYFPECSVWDVKVDVVGLIQSARSSFLAFVELKTKPVTLRDLGQLIGYCRVCKPVFALLLSPNGLSQELGRLLKSYGRLDVLTIPNGQIGVGTWDQTQSSPEWQTMIPGGNLPTLVSGGLRKTRGKKNQRPV